MKKILITTALLFILGANAQERRVKTNDTIRSQTTSVPTEPTTTNKVESVKMQSDGEIEAEKKSKDKGSNKNYTKVNPEKIAPIVGDTVKRPKPVRK